MAVHNMRPVVAPQKLKDVVQAVFGTQARCSLDSDQRLEQVNGNVYQFKASDSVTPAQLTTLYSFPVEGDPDEQCIGIVELAEGYCAADLAQHFAGLNLSSGLKTVAVDHGVYLSTDDPSGFDGEIMLDIDVVGTFAPAVHIVVYFAPDAERGCLVAWQIKSHSLEESLAAHVTA